MADDKDMPILSAEKSTERAMETGKDDSWFFNNKQLADVWAYLVGESTRRDRHHFDAMQTRSQQHFDNAMARSQQHYDNMQNQLSQMAQHASTHANAMYQQTVDHRDHSFNKTSNINEVDRLVAGADPAQAMATGEVVKALSQNEPFRSAIVAEVVEAVAAAFAARSEK